MGGSSGRQVGGKPLRGKKDFFRKKKSPKNGGRCQKFRTARGGRRQKEKPSGTRRGKAQKRRKKKLVATRDAS